MSPASLRAALFLVLLGILMWSVRRAAGRLAPRAALGPIVFLATRRPVLIAWVLGTAGMLALILPRAIERGHDTLSDFLSMAGLSAFCGMGAAVLAVGPVWAVIRAFGPAPTCPLEPGEEVLQELAANHFLGGEARGGKLLVTTRRLCFRPHRFNVQLDPWSVRLEDIRSLETEGDRFLLVGTGARKEWIVTSRPKQLAEALRARWSRPASPCDNGAREGT